MAEYIVTAGQNIYDVALHLTGSVEGIVDLLVSNPSLSLDESLTPGQRLQYTEGFILDADVRAYFERCGIVPACGERHVYPKSFSAPETVRFDTLPTLKAAEFAVSGRGTLEVDWGDNSQPERIALAEHVRTFRHLFDSDVRVRRRIRWYFDGELRTADWSGLAPQRILLLRPLPVESLTLNDIACNPDAFALLEGILSLDMRGCTLTTLQPFLGLGSLRSFDMRSARMRSAAADEYLLSLVAHYGLRRSCEVWLPVTPGGEYREPARHDGASYTPASGMEALWVLLHEEAWNEATPWIFHIEDKTYTYEPHDTGNI